MFDSKNSGVRRRHISALLFGTAIRQRGMMRWTSRGMSDILDSRVHIGEVFDLDFDAFDEKSD